MLCSQWCSDIWPFFYHLFFNFPLLISVLLILTMRNNIHFQSSMFLVYTVQISDFWEILTFCTNLLEIVIPKHMFKYNLFLFSQEPSNKRVRPLARVTSLANLISPVRNGAVRRFGQTIQVGACMRWGNIYRSPKFAFSVSCTDRFILLYLNIIFLFWNMLLRNIVIKTIFT